MERSPTLSLRVRGPWAIFTRPELKVERVTYPCMTPSAARGVLEAVLWKPAIVWRIERIRVLNEISFTQIRRNEVNNKITVPKRKTIEEGGALWRYFADEDRSQRNTIALRNADYVIEAHFEMTERAGREDNVTKFVDMFQRRVAKGQHFHQPYLGCRECIAEVLPANDAPPPIDVSRELGIMLWDIEYGKKERRPRFFVARLDQGILHVPENPEESLAALSDGAVA